VELSATPGAGAAATERPTEALVRRVDFGGVSLVADGGTTFDAIARGKLMGARKSLGNAVVVGDRVTVAWEGERAMIERVAPRRNAFSRRASGERAVEQVVAANLDQVVCVASLRRPEFRQGLVDRVVAQGHVAGLPVLLALNKTDLAEPGEVEALLAELAPAGVSGIGLCAKRGIGVEALREACLGRRSLFIGHSGVGKSTLLDLLAPGHELLQGEVNEVTGKGRHTTTAALLLQPEPGLELIDTPGIRAFSLWGVDEQALEACYPELAPYLGRCRFRDCRHDREPGCAVLGAVESGAIPASRWESFVHLREELAAR
jgi:ribosome biogenesis GTPase